VAKKKDQPEELSTLNMGGVAEVPMRLENLDPSTLTPHPLNPRSHPARQRRALADIMDAVGMLKPIIYNERTGHIIDGHMRVEEFLERNADSIPALVVDLPEEDEMQALYWLDRIGELREIDTEVNMVLQSQLDTESEYLQRLSEMHLEDGDGLLGEEPNEAAFSEDKRGVGLNLGEKFNYVVLLFKTDLDWFAAQEHFDIKQERDPLNPYTHTRVGIGRVIDGGKYLNQVRP
jgi:hypothetical protein